MANEKPATKPILDKWPAVKIDSDGVFKYVLVEAYAEDEAGAEVSKLLVRGTASAEYHADIFDPEDEKLREAGLDGQCLGGGRILHESANKYLKVYGYSVGFGKADHTKTIDVLKSAYPGYKMEWSDEGY